jgi:Tfp pilus assembly protein PilZ
MSNKDFAEAISSSERRGADRKKLIVDVHYNDGDATGIANTRDIGIGGLYMTTNAKLDIGTAVFMQISIGAKELSLNGVVVYSDPGHGVGIRFQDLTTESEKTIKQELNLE